jgi:hypothetical protein
MMSRLRGLRKKNLAPVLALVLGASLLAACSSAGITDMIPTAAGGLPANTPERPATAPDYPAINAMPQRREAPLTDDEVNRTKSELTTLRKQQEERASSAKLGAEPEKAAEPVKKEPAPAKTAKKPKEKNASKDLTSAKDQSK